MKNSNSKVQLNGVIQKFSKINNGRIYPSDSFKNQIKIMTLKVDVKPHIDAAIKDGYINRILEMIDDDLIEIYLRQKKIEKIIKNIKK